MITSNVTGGITLVEANLSGNGTQKAASGPAQVQILTLENKIWYLNGICAGSSPGDNSVNANVNNSGSFSVTFDEGGNAITGQASLLGSTISGSYALTGSSCPDLVGNLGYPNGYDTGGFTGTPVPSITGNFAGSLNLPEGAENTLLSIQSNPDQTVTIQASLTGESESGVFTFSGPLTGNVMLVSGTINGTTRTWLGLYDSTGRFTGTANSVLIFDYDVSAKAGLLLKQ